MTTSGNGGDFEEHILKPGAKLWLSNAHGIFDPDATRLLMLIGEMGSIKNRVVVAPDNRLI